MSSYVRLLLTAVLGAFVPFGGAAVGQEKENPIVTQVKGKLKDTGKPFTMLVRLQLKDGGQEKFEAAFAKAIGPSRKEKGCRAYDLNRDADNATRYVVYERWQNLAALEEHMRTPHFAALIGEVGDLLAGPPEVRVLLPAGE